MKLAELQGETGDCRTEGHRVTLLAPYTRQGAYSISASRQNVPKLNGDESKHLMWRETHRVFRLFLFSYRVAVAPQAVPVRVGDERVLPSEVRRQHPFRDTWHLMFYRRGDARTSHSVGRD